MGTFICMLIGGALLVVILLIIYCILRIKFSKDCSFPDPEDVRLNIGERTFSCHDRKI